MATVTRSAGARAAPLIPILCALLLLACRPSPDGNGGAASAPSRPVVIYCSADEAFARPLLMDFEKQSGIPVRPVFDTEAGKTTGLVERLRAERGRPIADVWWSSEIFGTIQLAEAGVLAEYRPPSASDIPDGFRDPAGRWTAFGLRGRVLVYDPSRVKRESLPKSWRDLASVDADARIALANPQFGTTRGHMATLLRAWGEPAFVEYLEALKSRDARIADGNAQTVLMTVRGQADFGWTDTDDARIAGQRGDSIEALLLPVSSGALRASGATSASAPTSPPNSADGPIWIPNSVALVLGGPNAEAGRRLLDYIASADMERRLHQSESGNIPVRAALRRELRIDVEPGAPPDFRAVAAVMPRSDELSRQILLH